MPQLNKGGKFIYGISTLKEDFSLQFPLQAVSEYHITSDSAIILFTGSKTTGGFCVTSSSLLTGSTLSHILDDNPELKQFTLPAGEFLSYKGRSYSWLPIEPDGKICLTPAMLTALELQIGSELLCIRSSNIAFSMGAKGPLLEKSRHYQGEIKHY